MKKIFFILLEKNSWSNINNASIRLVNETSIATGVLGDNSSENDKNKPVNINTGDLFMNGFTTDINLKIASNNYDSVTVYINLNQTNSYKLKEITNGFFTLEISDEIIQTKQFYTEEHESQKRFRVYFTLYYYKNGTSSSPVLETRYIEPCTEN